MLDGIIGATKYLQPRVDAPKEPWEQKGVLAILRFTGCRACPERSRRRSPLPKEVRNPRRVPHLVKWFTLPRLRWTLPVAN